MRVGLYPGSFDPITNGHIDIIKRSLAVVDKLIVGIGISATKTPMFSLEQRMAMIESEMGPIAKTMGAELSVTSFEGLLVDVARQQGANLIIRGLRTAADFDYEAQMTSMNRAMAPEIETVFLAASANVGFISSTLIRQIHAMGGDVSPFVPRVVLDNI
jgi:pantetheine-phosphate adenylyltransferase